MGTIRPMVASALVMGLMIAQPVAAQTASSIVERMLGEYERRIASVENYTVVQSTMGFETVSYFEKEMLNGRPVFQLRRSSTAGIEANTEGAGVDDLYLMGDDFGRLSQYIGRDKVEGFDVLVLDVPDLSEVGFGRNVTPDADFTPKRGRIMLDAESYVPRRFEFEGEMKTEQGVHEVTTSVVLGDYREAEGLLLPYRTTVSIEGLGAAIDPDMRAQFEEMQRELANMPEAQRRMVESMMSAQIEQFRSMMDGGGEAMTVELTVNEVRVNAGPPRR
ncbi:MAG: hypothetical protein O2958_14780 [Gemmatimonadetes bacterium]|nr:hypothetical protein [Gemmatimonadota bacterium]MDA1102981.1 hypothetical protein [Gemmatimonadota bacterium]